MKKVKEVKKVAWVRPKVRVEKLTMKSLLGENGWMDTLRSTDRRLLAMGQYYY